MVSSPRSPALAIPAVRAAIPAVRYDSFGRSSSAVLLDERAMLLDDAMRFPWSSTKGSEGDGGEVRH